MARRDARLSAGEPYRQHYDLPIFSADDTTRILASAREHLIDTIIQAKGAIGTVDFRINTTEELVDKVSTHVRAVFIDAEDVGTFRRHNLEIGIFVRGIERQRYRLNAGNPGWEGL